jgi:hypothetical protein
LLRAVGLDQGMNKQNTYEAYIIDHASSFTVIKCDLCPLSYIVTIGTTKKQVRLDHEAWCCDQMTWIIV